MNTLVYVLIFLITILLLGIGATVYWQSQMPVVIDRGITDLETILDVDEEAANMTPDKVTSTSTDDMVSSITPENFNQISSTTGLPVVTPLQLGNNTVQDFIVLVDQQSQEDIAGLKFKTQYTVQTDLEHDFALWLYYDNPHLQREIYTQLNVAEKVLVANAHPESFTFGESEMLSEAEIDARFAEILFD